MCFWQGITYIGNGAHYCSIYVLNTVFAGEHQMSVTFRYFIIHLTHGVKYCVTANYPIFVSNLNTSINLLHYELSSNSYI